MVMNGSERKAGEGARRGGKGGLLVGLVLGAASFGGAFYGVASGFVPLPWGAPEQAAAGEAATPWKEPAYVELEPMVVPLGPDASAAHLRASLVLDVAPGREEDVASALPRIVDALNVYLRALDERDLESPALTLRMRAQMLQQVRLVAPENSVNAVLLREFLLS